MVFEESLLLRCRVGLETKLATNPVRTVFSKYISNYEGDVTILITFPHLLTLFSICLQRREETALGLSLGCLFSLFRAGLGYARAVSSLFLQSFYVI